MFKIKNLPLTISTIVVISLIVGWGISLVLAWDDPTADPPYENVFAPINVSSIAQTKAGDLNIGDSMVVINTITADVFLGEIHAANVTPGIFASNYTYGNYTFNDSLGSPLLYIDAFNARIGIGDDTPDYTLDVSGDLNVTGTIYGTLEETGGWVDDGTIVRLKTSTDNVGIGTTLPGASLDVYKEHASTPATIKIRSKDTAAGSPPFSTLEFTGSTTTDISGDFKAGRIVAGYDGFQPQHSRLTLQSVNNFGNYIDTLSIKNGNVGIGTTGPGYKLDVNGDIRASSNVITDALEWTSDSAMTWMPSTNNHAFNFTAGGQIALIDDGSDMLIETNRSNFKFNKPLYAGNGNILLNSSGGNSYINGGNVGIGTTSPTTAKLVISSTGAAIDVGSQKIINLAAPVADSDATNKNYVDSVVGGTPPPGGPEVNAHKCQADGTCETNNISASGTLTSNVGTGSNRFAWTGGAMRRMTDQGGFSLYSDSSVLLHSGDHGVSLISDLGIINTTTGENLYLTSDGSVYVITNRQTDYASSRTFIFGTNGNLTVPGSLMVSGGGSFTNTVTVATPTAASHAATKNYVDSSITGGTTANAEACNADDTCETNDLNVSGTLNMTDGQLQNVRALQGKDWDDDTGGTDNKYRLLFRDGAHQFYNGGVVVGNYANGTWSDLADGTLIVEGKVGIGTTTPGGTLTVDGSIESSGALTVGGRFYSVGTTDKVTNLNADLLDGQDYSSSWPTTLANIQSAATSDFHNIGGTDADTWITTQTCLSGEYLSSVGKASKACSAPPGGITCDSCNTQFVNTSGNETMSGSLTVNNIMVAESFEWTGNSTMTWMPSTNNHAFNFTAGGQIALIDDGSDMLIETTRSSFKFNQDIYVGTQGVCLANRTNCPADNVNDAIASCTNVNSCSISGDSIADNTIDASELENYVEGAQSRCSGGNVLTGAGSCVANYDGVGVATCSACDGRFINVGESGDSIADNTIDSSEIQDNTLTASDLAAGSVGTSEVLDNSLTASDLAPNSCGNSELIDSPTFTKIYVGTIDPIYEIDGKKYATYVADFAGGVRTETSGVIQLNSEAKYVIDFDDLEKGSDLWLFWETSNKEMNDLVVILSSGFEGKAWYNKDGHKLTIYGDESGEVSYRLTSPRLDDEEWGNLVVDNE